MAIETIVEDGKVKVIVVNYFTKEEAQTRVNVLKDRKTLAQNRLSNAKVVEEQEKIQSNIDWMDGRITAFEGEIAKI